MEFNKEEYLSEFIDILPQASVKACETQEDCNALLTRLGLSIVRKAYKQDIPEKLVNAFKEGRLVFRFTNGEELDSLLAYLRDKHIPEVLSSQYFLGTKTGFFVKYVEERGGAYSWEGLVDEVKGIPVQDWSFYMQSNDISRPIFAEYKVED